MKSNSPNINHEKIKQKRRKRTIWFLVTTTIIIVSLVALILVKPDLFPDITYTFLDSSEDIYTQEQLDSTTPDKSYPQDIIQESQPPPLENTPDATPSPASVAKKSPSEASTTTEDNRVVTFNDLALEQGIRKILNKETGDIMIRDIDKISEIRFIGPFAEGKGKPFIIGYAPDSYIDANNEKHHERGDIKSLSDLLVSPNIDIVEVGWQNEFDINSLYGFRIRRLSLFHNNISNISVLSSIENLDYLYLCSNNISDISPLSNLSLSGLSLGGNNITDITPLANMSLLTFLDIGCNPIMDANPLRNLVNLTYLAMGDFKVNDFSILDNMVRLETLFLTNTGLSDLSVLKNNTSLKYLYICVNNVCELSPIKNLKNLEHLDISFTKISDLSVLRELPKLRSVSMYDVKLDDESIIDELSHIDFMR